MAHLYVKECNHHFDGLVLTYWSYVFLALTHRFVDDGSKSIWHQVIIYTDVHLSVIENYNVMFNRNRTSSVFFQHNVFIVFVCIVSAILVQGQMSYFHFINNIDTRVWTKDGIGSSVVFAVLEKLLITTSQPGGKHNDFLIQIRENQFNKNKSNIPWPLVRFHVSVIWLISLVSSEF